MTTSSDPPPSHVGPYTLLSKLGAGGMGEVWLARDPRLERDVALKLLPQELRGDPERRTRFLREARAVAQLSHPHITTIHEVGEAEGRDFIALEYVDGRTLAEVLAQRRLSLPELIDLALPLADAIAYAHERGVVHRDIKPANVMVTRRGHPKLLDFGLAKRLEEGTQAPEAKKSTTLTTWGAVFGTPAAMSPEQALGRPVDERSDVFSFGSLLYEMATGAAAFRGGTAMEVIDAVIHREPGPLRQARPDLPEGLASIVGKALRKDPAERYQTMGDLAADLRHFKRTTESGLVPPGRPRRAPGLLVGALVAVVAAVAVVWMLQLQRGASSAPPATSDGPSPLIAVMGFESLSDPDDEEALGRMLTSLVATDLAEHGGLRVVSTAKVLASLEEVKQGAGGRFESAAATRAAQATGASLMLVGQILRKGEGVLLSAELVDVASGETRGSLREEVAAPDQVFELAGDLAESVRRQLGVEQALEPFDLSQSLTDSPEAYSLYNAGELALHRRDFSVARSFFHSATERDPTFAMAWFRLGMSDSWLDRSEAPEAFGKALAHADRLSERWRVIVQAAAARERNDYDMAYSVLAPLIEAEVDIPEAYNEFGEILTHSSRYRDPSRSRRCFQRALELDPTYEVVLYHLIHQTLQAGDLAGAQQIVARSRSSKRSRNGPMALLVAERRYAEAVMLAEEELSAEGQTDWENYVRSARNARDEEAFPRAVATWWTSEPGERHWQACEQAQWDFLRGRFTPMLEQMALALQLSPGTFERSQVRMLRAQLCWCIADFEAAATAGREAVEEDPYEFVAWFWLGLAQLSAGRTSEAEAVLADGRAALERSRSAVGASVLDLLEAEIHSAAGEHQRAREALDRSCARPPELRQRELELMITARVAEEAGDIEGAIAAWRELLQPGFPRYVDSTDIDVLPLYQLGRLEHEHGELDAARTHLVSFLEFWNDADRSLPSIQEARRCQEQLDAR